MLTATLTSETNCIQGLASGSHRYMARPKSPVASYKLLGLVILIHVMAVFLLIMTASNKVKLSNPLIAMTISLVSNPSSETEIAPASPVGEKSKSRKLESILKPNIQVTKPLAENTEIAEKINTENLAQQIVQEKVQSSELTYPEKAASVVETKQQEPAMSEPKLYSVAEQAHEPPRFGAAYLNNPAPDYPQLARRLGQQGRVLLKVLVAENGIAEAVELVTSSGFEKLDQAAIEAVKRWSFISAKHNNKAVSAYVLVPIKFSLNK